MRPLRLALSAFGSYGGELEVDFARMGRHGVFAITGPTGAGKSTIFDALVYALYGDLPGFRVDGNVRSHYALPGVETRVVLELEAHGEVWRVERSPTQLVPRKRGDGPPIERKGSVVLARRDDPAGGLTRKAEVDRRVVELVGLTKDQFEQVVLIPQGRFEEVLKADTKDRAALLRRLFPVDVFARVTEALRAIADERRRAYEEAESGERAELDAVGRAIRDLVDQVPDDLVPDDLGRAVASGGIVPGELAGLAATAEEVVGSLEERVEQAKARCDAARRARDDAQTALERWAQWQDDRQAMGLFAHEEQADEAEAHVLRRAAFVAPLRSSFDGWRRVTADLDRLVATRDERHRTVGERWLDAYDRAALASPVASSALAAELDADADRIEDAATALDRLTTEAEQLAEEGATLAARGDELAATRDRLGADWVALGDDRRRLAGLAGVVRLLEAARVAHRRDEEALEAARRRAEAGAEVVVARRRAAEAAGALGRAEETASAVRAAWRDGLAGRLAAHLVDGEPCPTCGSSDHPVPAALHPDAPDDEALERAESELEEARRAQATAERALAEAEVTWAALGDGPELAEAEEAAAASGRRLAVLEESKTRYEELAVEVRRRGDVLDRANEVVGRQSHTFDTDLARHDERCQAHARARAEHEARFGAGVFPRGDAEARRALAEAVRALAAAAGALERAEAERDVHAGALAEVVERVGLAGPGELATVLLPDEELLRRQAELGERSDRRRQVLERVAAYESAGVPAERPDPSPFEERLRSAEADHAELVGRAAVARRQLASLRAAPGRLAEALEALEGARRSFEQAQTVAHLCAGQGGTGMGVRRSLEHWVLAAYLRQVLAQANARLAVMTAGRYSLRLDDGPADGRRLSGLDLAVFDVNTGLVRPATTLSGGETFMAALSLALGLADVVSSGANRQMGALFVDEGFGSLDPQALDGVVEVLRSLEDGGRIVGVISHVAELNQALPNGISVVGTTQGSVATLRYPPE